MERGFYFKEELCDGFFLVIYGQLFLVMVFFFQFS
jgi:hypothetical protein